MDYFVHNVVALSECEIGPMQFETKRKEEITLFIIISVLKDNGLGWNLKNKTNGCICKTETLTEKTNLSLPQRRGNSVRDEVIGKK